MSENIYLPIIQAYIDHGFSPIPIPFKKKSPIIKGWTTLSVTAENLEAYFDGGPSNIGILTGEPSGVVDVDIDSPDALRFAPWFLLDTNCIFGHESKPKSHWLYRVADAGRVEQFLADAMIIEVRGNNRCTVFPPSVHPSGENIEFDSPDDYEPTPSTWSELKRAASKIAIATELLQAWSLTNRHQLTLAIAATLVRQDWNIEEVRYLVTAIATDELPGRLAAVKTTFEAYAAGNPISGDKRLDEIVGERMAECIRRWASPLKSSAQSSLEPNPTSTAPTDLSNDSSAADAFAKAFQSALIYSNKEWFRRKNEVFEPICPELVQGIAKDFFQRQADKRCLTRNRINAAVELSRARFHCEPSYMDANPDAVGCKDGSVMDLITGRKFDGGKDFVTKKLGANVNSTASCPEWLKFLNRIFEQDAELIDFVQRADALR